MIPVLASMVTPEGCPLMEYVIFSACVSGSLNNWAVAIDKGVGSFEEMLLS